MQSEITTYKSDSRGFTLIELMIVVALIGIVLSMAVAAYSSYLQNASAQAMVSNFETAIKTTKANYLVARQLHTTGAVGVEFSGSYASQNSVVTLHRPAFAGIDTETVIIAQISF